MYPVYSLTLGREIWHCSKRSLGDFLLYMLVLSLATILGTARLHYSIFPTIFPRALLSLGVISQTEGLSGYPVTSEVRS
jgi:hypothetical protein